MSPINYLACNPPSKKARQQLKIDDKLLIKFKKRCIETRQKYSVVVEKLVYNALHQDKKKVWVK